jgi:hypothetical protein
VWKFQGYVFKRCPMIYGFSNPKNPGKVYDQILNLQRSQGLPGFNPMMEKIQLHDPEYIALVIGGCEP